FSKVIDFLLGNYADISSRTLNPGNTALHLAAKNGNLAIVNSLLNHIKEKYPDQLKAFINASGENGMSPLHCAVYYGHDAVVKDLLAKDATDVSAKTNLGNTALHVAAQEGHLKIVNSLLNHIKEKYPDELRAFINASGENGMSPLHCAVYYGHDAVVKVLLAEDATNVSAVTNLGNTALHVAAQEGHIEIVNTLLNHIKEKYPLQISACINAKGNTSLHLAAENGHLDVVNALLDYRKQSSDEAIAFINAKNKDGLTPLHIASGKGHLETVEAIVKNLAAAYPDKLSEIVNAKDKNALTPLHYAAHNDHSSVVQALVK
ncbi:unnamed protein product, partial [Sphagnum jensenii]